MSTFKRIALGELFDDLEIGNKIKDILGVPNRTDEDQSDGLSIIESLGATLLLITISVLVLVFLLLASIWCYKRNSKPLPSCIAKVANKIFFNAIIRYTLLNCLKFNVLASVALFKTSNTISELCLAGLIFTVLNILAVLYSYKLWKHKEDLSE